MPKEDKRRKELTQKEIEAEKFRTFFSTSVAQVPEAMSRREEEETPPKRGLFGGLFQRGKPEPETKEPAERGLELPPTGEIVLGDDAEEPQADLELVLEPEEAAAEQPVMPEPKKQPVPATPKKAPQEPAKPEAPAPEPAKPAEPEKPAAPAKPAEPGKKEKPENKETAPAPSNKTKKQETRSAGCAPQCHGAAGGRGDERAESHALWQAESACKVCTQADGDIACQPPDRFGVCRGQGSS